MLRQHGRFAYRSIEHRPHRRWPGGKGVALYFALIAEATARIAQEEGRAPTGWLGPWLAETACTPELLKQAGYRYVLDWCADDQPFWLRTAAGPLLSLPYSQEVNDSAAIMGRQVSAADFADMIIAQVDQLIEDAVDGVPLAFSIALQTNIIGQPFRRRELARALRHIRGRSDDLWITRGRDIAEYVESDPAMAP